MNPILNAIGVPPSRNTSLVPGAIHEGQVLPEWNCAMAIISHNNCFFKDFFKIIRSQSLFTTYDLFCTIKHFTRSQFRNSFKCGYQIQEFQNFSLDCQSIANFRVLYSKQPVLSHNRKQRQIATWLYT